MSQLPVGALLSLTLLLLLASGQWLMAAPAAAAAAAGEPQPQPQPQPQQQQQQAPANEEHKHEQAGHEGHGPGCAQAHQHQHHGGSAQLVLPDERGPAAQLIRQRRQIFLDPKQAQAARELRAAFAPNQAPPTLPEQLLGQLREFQDTVQERGAKLAAQAQQVGQQAGQQLQKAMSGVQAAFQPAAGPAPAQVPLLSRARRQVIQLPNQQQQQQQQLQQPIQLFSQFVQAGQDSGARLLAQTQAGAEQLLRAGQQAQRSLQSVIPSASSAAGNPLMTSSLVGSPSLIRLRRQSAGQPQQSPLAFLAELGPQVERAQSTMRMFSSLMGQPQQGGQQQQQQQPQQQQSPAGEGVSTIRLMSQLSELLRATQEKSPKPEQAAQLDQQQQQQQQQQPAGIYPNLMAGQQQQQQQPQQPAPSSPGGFQSALAEIGQGLQKIAMNNPNLLPDVKQLYTSVSSKLSSSSSSGSSGPQQQQQQQPTVPVPSQSQPAFNPNDNSAIGI